MNRETVITEQSQFLAASYIKLNEQGRDLLDKTIIKLTENHTGINEIKQREALRNEKQI